MAVTPEHTDIHHDAAAYQHGSMEIQEQASTYSLFTNLAKWGSLIIGALILLLVLWFRPEGSFLVGLIAAGVMSVAGWWFMRSKPAH
jgi:VIT1/CCC1 family predicted Fe2+/Mn2+ transporter